MLPYLCRVEYDADDLAGGEEGTFVIRRRAATREDFVILNKRDQKLMCSSWQLLPAPGDQTPRVSPCVVYCHCNSGSRVDAEEAIWGLLPLGIRVFALDFSVRAPHLYMALAGVGAIAVMKIPLECTDRINRYLTGASAYCRGQGSLTGSM